ncbi:ankyrin repeat-containing domain protein [Dactylonectria macrodidyma]|uniref:Ankyrin repeat-containing domain protein n=1 Tax=Dactylonectria macrodidyma TaxID=307937 RepID=A0A9P9DVR0_9HYPO|nr:ankyrin repeat-containing domain protein [Dactylonectria macrodidyma]
MVQNIAAGGTGNQTSVRGGEKHQVSYGSGSQYNATTMHFVRSSEDYRARSDILHALPTLSYLERKNRNPDRVLGTCNWFIGHPDFRQWQESKSSNMLWVSGNPGCGKSVLAKYLADTVLQSTESRTTCYFFFKDEFKDQRSAKTALRCILHQLLLQREDLFSDKIVRRFEAYQSHLTNSFDELWQVLVMVSQGEAAGELVCILDAFDECEDQEQFNFAQTLTKFYDPANDMKNHCKLKFLITSRPYDKIGRWFHPLDSSGQPIIHLKGEDDKVTPEIAQEIDVYIEHKVSCMRQRLCLSLDEEQLLLERLRGAPNQPNQTYLWVYLTLESIENDISIDKAKIDDATSSLPDSVDEAYERILAKSIDHEQAKRMLHIIVAAVRPLTLAEMDLALATRTHHKSYRSLSARPEERFGRITDSRIYLLHQTAKEFLIRSDRTDRRGSHNDQLVWKSSLDPPESHRILCQICVSHLLFKDFVDHPLEEDKDEGIKTYLGAHEFLDYSATHWATHFRSAAIEEDEMVRKAHQICNVNLAHYQTWLRVYWANTRSTFPSSLTTLMIASYFGLEAIVRLELGEYGVEVNAIDRTYGRSAISWASENGFDDTVKLLIKRPRLGLKNFAELSFPRGAKVDAKDKHGRTPLSYAAWNGHIDVAQRLVKEGARADSRDKNGASPISYALCSEHVDVVKRLEKGAQVGSVDKIRRELLLSSSINGNDGVVTRLLKDGASVKTFDKTGRTPLSHAAEKGHDAIVKQLLENGAHVETPDNTARTPLLYAAEKSNRTIVQLLLRGGAKLIRRT